MRIREFMSVDLISNTINNAINQNWNLNAIARNQSIEEIGLKYRDNLCVIQGDVPILAFLHQVITKSIQLSNTIFITEPIENNLILKYRQKISESHSNLEELSFKAICLIKCYKKSNYTVSNVESIRCRLLFISKIRAKVIFFFKYYLVRSHYLLRILGAPNIIFSQKIIKYNV